MTGTASSSFPDFFATPLQVLQPAINKINKITSQFLFNMVLSPVSIPVYYKPKRDCFKIWFQVSGVREKI
jgi:hypothetical protein